MLARSIIGLLAACLGIGAAWYLYSYLLEYQEPGVAAAWAIATALLGVAALPNNPTRKILGAACFGAMVGFTYQLNLISKFDIEQVASWVPQQPNDESLASLMQVTSNKSVNDEFEPYLCLRKHLATRTVLVPQKARLNQLALKAVSRANTKPTKAETLPEPDSTAITCGEFKVMPNDRLPSESEPIYTYNHERKAFVISS